MVVRLHPEVGINVRTAAAVPPDIAAIWKEAAEEATRRPGDIWRALFGLPLTAAAREIFERARDLAGWNFVLPPDVMFHAGRLPIECTFTTPSQQQTVMLQTVEQARALQRVLSGDWQTSNGDRDAAALAAQWIAAGLLAPEEERSPRFAEPGVYRMRNSSIVFRSEQALVVVDPDFYDGRWLSGNDIAMLDAVAISHSHMDHFSYLSLLQFPRDLTILVPEVEKQSILSDDMAGLLRDAGFTNVIVAPWYASHTVKDITLHTLPFYGEQPWLSFASPDFALRNCGNTWVIETPTERTWLLVDSGSEHGHSMLDVADDARSFGPIDIVMSGIWDVRWHPGQIDGWGGQWWCYPIEHLNAPETWPNGQLMKMGHSDLRELLARVQARHFLPYTTPSYLAGSQAEADQLAQIRAAGALTTELHAWGQGDRAEMKDGRAVVRAR